MMGNKFKTVVIRSSKIPTHIITAGFTQIDSLKESITNHHTIIVTKSS
jgi:hypothetical protein